jgi:hypothetical protein
MLQLAAAVGLVWLVLRTAATDELLLGFGVPAPVGEVLLVLPLAGGVAAVGALAAVAISARAGRLPTGTVPVLVISGATLSLVGVAAAVGLVL